MAITWLSSDCHMILRTSEVLSSESQLIKSNELFWYPPPCYVSIRIFRCQSLQCFHLDSTASQVCQTGTLSVRSWEVGTTHTTSPHSPSTYMHTREDRYVQSWSWPQCDSLCKGNTMAPSAVAKDVTYKISKGKTVFILLVKWLRPCNMCYQYM